MLALDADNFPIRDPEYLFESGGYRETGAIFWPDVGRTAHTSVIWKHWKRLNKLKFPMNETYYLSKWGGPTHGEIFPKPWNESSVFELEISNPQSPAG